MLDNTPKQPSKFKAKNKDNHTRFKTSMLRSSLCNYSDSYILVRGTLFENKAAQDQPNNTSNKKLMFKNFVSFTKLHEQNKQYASR